MSELKPCPFCGAGDWFYDGIAFDCLEHEDDCYLYIESTEMILRSDSNQRDKWNRRAEGKGEK